VLVQWRYKRGVRLELNPHYHSPEIVRSKTVDCLSIEDANTSVLAFESGRLDWLSEVAVEYQADMLAQRQAYEQRHAEELQSLLAQGMSLDDALASLPPPGTGERRNIHVFPTFGTDFYSFNCRPTLVDGRVNPFHDARVRRAFVLATDRARLVREVTRLDEPVATVFIPPNSIPGYESPVGLGFDPDRAREELKAAGWFDRSNTPRYVSLSLALREMWQRELGVRIELRAKESKFFKEDLIRGNYMIARGRWSGDYTDPTTFLDICRTGDGNNDRGFSDPRVDELLDQAALERAPAKRMEILSECERILFAEEVPMLVLCQLVQLYMYEPGHIRGLTTHPRLVQYLWQIEVGER
jgi:oligopeptide transport system substrate-binding protein